MTKSVAVIKAPNLGDWRPLMNGITQSGQCDLERRRFHVILHPSVGRMSLCMHTMQHDHTSNESYLYYPSPLPHCPSTLLFHVPSPPPIYRSVTVSAA